MATIKDVSRLAGVSISTVSRVINNTTPVTIAKRKAVLKAMATLDFHPNTFAQALVRKRSDCIGILLGDLCGGAFFTQMMQGIEKVIAGTGMFTMMMAGYHQAQREQQAIEALRYRQCDALILHSRALSDKKLCALVKDNLPVILINRYIADIADHCIYFDNIQSTLMAVSYLAKQGHQNIALINSNIKGCPDAMDRQKGFIQAMKICCPQTSSYQITHAFPDEGGGYYAASQLRQYKRHCSAIIAFNDAMASGAMAYLWENGIRIPDDISIIGCDNVPYAQFIHPKLTTIKYPIEEMGALAAQLVLQQLHGKFTQAKARCFSPSLVFRESVASIIDKHQTAKQKEVYQ